ncbi:CMF_collapsed_G0005950.mRNA.1.CDS.1 [Saccharomyces cerevisiae]|nr:CMF_collapsed_G0005950.mRNA.1.CDS.1 [Saccharomyces cerevisiae]
MDDICSIAENINRTLFNILGTEIDDINLNTNNLYNSGFSFSFSFPQQYNFINPGFGFVEWLTNNYAEVRGDGYWEDVFVHLAL